LIFAARDMAASLSGSLPGAARKSDSYQPRPVLEKLVNEPGLRSGLHK
jgi:hypothetical protein